MALIMAVTKAARRFTYYVVTRGCGTFTLTPLQCLLIGYQQVIFTSKFAFGIGRLHSEVTISRGGDGKEARQHIGRLEYSLIS